VPERCLEAAAAVQKIGKAKLVAVHYPGGAVAIDGDGQHYQNESLNLSTDQVMGSVGAGDAFAAVLLISLMLSRQAAYVQPRRLNRLALLMSAWRCCKRKYFPLKPDSTLQASAVQPQNQPIQSWRL